MGFGLLSWKTPSNTYRRHLIVAQASIELDTKKGTLFLKQGAEGAKLNLEQDMLDVQERCSVDIDNTVKEQISEIGDEVWNTSTIETILKTWMHPVSSDGVYSADLNPTKDLSQVLKITYAPAIILRRRRQLKLAETFDKIVAQIKKGEKIPFGIRRVVEITDDFNHDDNDDATSPIKSSDFQEILFPKPANDEQRRIVEYLRSRQGVLVQGPPGTGKSHTIVNLLCHLLANGKRVLVTSQMRNALKVLKALIPKEVAALCVNLLGSDKDSLQSLKESVEGIVYRKFEWDQNPEQNRKLVLQLKSQLEELNKQKAELTRKLYEIRESETYQYRICDGFYEGTSQKIAEKVSSELTKNQWLNIAIAEKENPPLSDEEATEFIRLYQSFSPEEVKEIEKELVQIDKLPTPEEFTIYCLNEKDAKSKYDAFGSIRENDIYHKIKTIDDKHLTQLKSEFRKFVSMWVILSKHKQPWVCSIIEDVISERDRRWRHLLEETEKCIETLKKHIDQVDKCSLRIAEGKDRSVIKADVEALLKHFEQGGKIRNWFIFYPKVIKNSWYIVKDTYVDGKLCNNPETLKKLLEVLECDEYLDAIWREWSVCITRPVGSRGAQLHDLEDLCEPLLEAMNLYSQMAKAKQSCAPISGLGQPAWHVMEEVELYVRTIDAVEAEKLFKNATAAFSKVKGVLQEFKQRPDTHTVVGEMYEAVTNRNEAVYGKLYKEIVDLEQKKLILAHREEFYNRLIESPVKSVAEKLAADPYQLYWIERFSCFSESWRWAQACTWLKEYINKLNEQNVSLELDYVEMKINRTVSQLAAEMAWGHCFARLQEPERMHLMSWANETRLIGKGTGKHAEKHRRNAREHMEHCRSAIPAWIMPLYRVAETVEPGVDKYDVVIIDEASQSGPDALFLQFLAKQIVVVGDNKQISPLSIGVPIQEVDWLREQYIADIPCKNALGSESSFFELAEILFSGRIVLREHFRCMPEIIQFSNNQFYSATPLIPLRQYPPKCLEPVKTYHVANGYRDGGTKTPRNLPEAEAIVAKTKECCAASEYDGKTMGIISLLGEYQARLIEDMLLKAIGPEEIAKRNIVCGDAYAFQGDERDVMFLSMVAAPPGTDGTSLVALTTPEASRRFNVAASRAKDQMWLFHTPTLNDFRNHECLRYRLLEYCQNYKKRLPGVDFEIQQLRIVANNKVNRAKFEKPGEQYSKYFDSWFEVDIFLKIVDRGYQVRPQFEVAKYYIDLMVQGSTKQLAVECYGDKWHSEPEQRERDMNRERILKRSGLIFWTVWGSEFYFNPSKSLEPLWQKLDELGISPGGKDKLVDSGHTVTKSENVTTNKADSEQVLDNETISVNQESLFSNRYPDEHRHFSSEELQDAIIAVLKQCPNSSCTKKSLTTRVCRYLNVITRGKPRDKFEQKIMKALGELENRCVVEEYTATNIRIRLVRDSW